MSTRPTQRPIARRSLGALVVGALLLAFLLAPQAARAQIPLFTPSPVSFQGEITSTGQLYSATGQDQRQPSSLGRLYVRSNLELFGVNVGLDMLFSTENGSRFGLSGPAVRQQLNQIGITPKWSWGRAYLGSFTDSYSNLTLNGIRLQGAGAAINPGWLRMGAFIGRSQNAAAGGALNGAFRRTMWGGRIGVGPHSEFGRGGFFDLVFLRATDSPSSLPSPDGATVEPGSGASLPVNPYAVTPQENVVMAAVNRLPFWGNRLTWQGEVAVSVDSRDRRAPALSTQTLDRYSSLLRSLVTPRASTYGDIAYTGRLDLRGVQLPGATPQSPRTLSAMVGYRYVGAGYVSLGLATLPADQSTGNARVSVRYRTWSASVLAARQHDNLLGQKLFTTVRNRLGASLDMRLTPRLVTSLRGSFGVIRNDATEEANRMDFTTWMATASQTLMLGPNGLWRAVSWSDTYQQAGDPNPARAASQLRAHDAAVRLTLGPSRSLTITPSVGASFSRLGTAGWVARSTYALAGYLRGNGGRWSVGAALTNARLGAGGSLRASINAQYRLTPGDRLNIGLRSNHVQGLGPTTGTFSEYVLNVGWTRQIR